MTGSTSWTPTSGFRRSSPGDSGTLAGPACAAFAHRLRLVFQGTWIRHCGWYSGSWIVRLVDRRYTKFDGSLVGERACVDGPVRRLAQRHRGRGPQRPRRVAAQARALRGTGSPAPRPAPRSPRAAGTAARGDTRPLVRAVLKDVIFPPSRPSPSHCSSTCTSSGSAYSTASRTTLLFLSPGTRPAFPHCSRAPLT